MKEGWEIKELQDCLSYIKNGANIKQTKGASGIPITRIETLSGGQFHRDKLGYADVYELGKFAPYVLDDADILMSHINSKAYIGRSVIYHKQGDEQIIHGMNLLRLKFFPDMINPEFANYYFKCTFFLSEVAKIRKDAVNQSSMAISDLKRIAIPVPPLSEQQHIVEELDLLSSIIEKKKAQLNELDNLAQSLFYEMFGDIENNTKSFETYKLGEVCNMKAGKAIKADELHDESYNLYPCYGGNGIRGYIDRFSHSGDFPIIGRQGALCGNVNFAMGDFYATEHAVVVTPIIDLNPLWLYYALIAMRLGQYAHGVAQPGLSVKDLNPLSIPIPQLSIQQQFASKIEAIEQQKKLIKKSIKEVETLFNSRMDFYFN